MSVNEPKIVIVGAGISGLNAAHTLHTAGIQADVYEGSDRIGGRIYSVKDVVGPGLVTEYGAEFIDTGHLELHRLVKLLGLELIDAYGPDHAHLNPMAFFFDGVHHSQQEAADAFEPYCAQIAADQATLPEVLSAANATPAMRELDALSIAGYFDRIGMTGWIREMFAAAYITEFGFSLEEQSALNFLDMVSADVSSSAISLYGESDERYRVLGGNQQMPLGLAARLARPPLLGHKLEALEAHGDGYRLSFAVDGGSATQVDADLVLLAMPFSTLRDVDLRVELPATKRRAIDTMLYGENAKVFAGVKHRVWRDHGYAGGVLADQGLQLAWDNSLGQPGDAGGLTIFSGGAPGLTIGEGTAKDQAMKHMPVLEQAFPGVTAALNGNFERMDWPHHEWARGSHCAYRPGEYSLFGGTEIQPVGGIYFAGDNCSLEWQGYMQGAAWSGRTSAEMMLTKLGVDVPAVD